MREPKRIETLRWELRGEVLGYFVDVARLEAAAADKWKKYQELCAKCGLTGANLGEGIHLAGSWDQHKDDMLIAAADARSEYEAAQYCYLNLQKESDAFLADVLKRESDEWRVFYLRYLKAGIRNDPVSYRQVADQMTLINGPESGRKDAHIYSPREVRHICKRALDLLTDAWVLTPPESELDRRASLTDNVEEDEAYGSLLWEYEKIKRAEMHEEEAKEDEDSNSDKAHE